RLLSSTTLRPPPRRPPPFPYTTLFRSPTTANGALTLNPDGSFTYVPAANANGTDSFQYQIRNAANEVSNTVTVTLTVTPVNDVRSEEHTSELQSRSDLVCRLLLEKKKN